ncbi:MAG: hypothetical protein RIR49_542 [Actinomycetota bacterium]
MAIDPATDERGLRADLLTTAVTAAPGQTVSVELQVLNTSAVIEQVQVNVLGIEVVAARSEPTTLTLFPDESARLMLHLEFPLQLAAGSHTALIQVVGQSTHAVSENELAVDVPASAGLAVSLDPPLLRNGKRGEFTMTAANTGNTVLTLLMRATDGDQRLKLAVDTPTVRIGPGETGSARITARHRRPLKGDPLEHVITVTAEQGDIAGSGTARFVQKPVITPGIITILTLVLILGLWAVAMFFGVRAALAGPPPTKTVPEAWAQGVGIEQFDAIAVGGSVTGKVVAASTAAPMPRVTVEAFDPDGVLVTAAATDEEGLYTLGGLLPLEYTLRFRGTGIQELWYPDSPTQAGATRVFVPPDAVEPDIDAVLVGEAASLAGRVIAGDDDPIDVSITVTAVDLLDAVDPVTVVAGEDGSWSVGGLVSPATYRIASSAPGYDTVESTQVVGPGEALVVNTVRLPAAVGVIAGSVVDADGNALGAVEVTVQRGDLVTGTVTPTAGVIGSFLVPDLPTPATYLVTFALEGFSSETLAVRLGPGQTVDGLSVTLTPAFGTVAGTVTSTAGQLLGGVTVTVAGSGLEVATSTFTSGEVGGFRLGELPMPGTYTVTFEFDGYRRETLQVTVTRDAPVATADVQLRPNLGRISGVVVDASTGDTIGAAVVVLSDGSLSRETTTASAPLEARGRFSLEAVDPGAYTVTVTSPGYTAVTVLTEATAGGLTSLRVELTAVSS